MRKDWRTRSLSRGCVRLKAHYVDSRRAPACISTPASCPASIFPDRPSTRIQPRKYSQVIVSRSLRKRQASAASTCIGASHWSLRRSGRLSVSHRRTLSTHRGCLQTLKRPLLSFNPIWRFSRITSTRQRRGLPVLQRYLFNLDEWAGKDQLRSDTGVDRQIVKSPVAWHSDYLQVGKRHVQMFSLKATPEASRPCLFSGLLSLDCDAVLCSTWRVKSAAEARHEIDAQEKFISFFKVGVLARVMSGRDTASLDTGAGAKAANNSVHDLSDVIRSLDKKAQGEFSLRLLLAARSPEQLRDVVPAVHRIFVDAHAQVMEETLGNL